MADFTQAHLDALNTAIASGELTVRYGDTTVTYRSLDELLRVRDMVKSDLQSSATAAQTYTLGGFSKG